MIPTALEGWTSNVIEYLLEQGYFESEAYDYKLRLPNKGDTRGRLRLRKECSAFANSDGGFLLFGVSDDRTLPPQERMVGFEPAFDFPIHFGEYTTQCQPTVSWIHKAIPISETNPNLLHIVHIPRSWHGPHMIPDDQKREAWYFPKRTNKGIEYMSYEEVRMAFTGQYERRRKLNLLRRELVDTKSQCGMFIIPDTTQRTFAPVASELPLGIIEAIISDSFLILEEHGGLLADLNQARLLARQINHATLQFFQELTRFGPGIDPTRQREQHNAKMQWFIQSLQSTIDRCIEGLDRVMRD